jgi:antibiotic biosynthesis monooxygenase (ABM) superfamily enzyme
MTNNKQQTAVEWLAKQMEILHYDYWAEHISKDEKNQRLKQLKEQAKEMEKEETTKFTIGYFNWLHNNGYKYNPKVKMYWKMMINETLFFTIEELMIEFNKIQ